MKRKILILLPTIILLLLSIKYLPSSYSIKQSIWLLTGLLIFFIISKTKLNIIKKLTIPFYLLCIFLLLFVLLYSKLTNGSRGWINLGFFTLQPSELTKISLILLSYFYSNNPKKSKIIYLLIYLVPSILTFLEPDTGAVIIYGIIFLVFLPNFFKKKSIIILFATFITIISTFTYIYFTNKDLFINLLGTSMYYRIDRLTSFKENNNMQTNNALISIGSGNNLYFPESTNDFFFAYSITSNIYLSFIIIFLYLVLLYLLLRNNNIISTTFFYILLFQIIENIGMNISLLPVIGIPLPFYSYGGSHIISSYIMLSLCTKKETKY